MQGLVFQLRLVAGPVLSDPLLELSLISSPFPPLFLKALFIQEGLGVSGDIGIVLCWNNSSLMNYLSDRGGPLRVSSMWS